MWEQLLLDVTVPTDTDEGGGNETETPSTALKAVLKEAVHEDRAAGAPPQQSGQPNAGGHSLITAMALVPTVSV